MVSPVRRFQLAGLRGIRALLRRLWPRTLIAWTRVLSGQFNDPLVGRDVLVGILAGSLMVLASLLVIMTHEHTPAEVAIIPALHSLRSSRLCASRVVFLVLDSLQFSLGSFFLLLLFRVVLRRTWLAVVMLLLVNAWSWTPIAVLYAIGTGAVGCFIFLRLGLLAGVRRTTAHVAAHHARFRCLVRRVVRPGAPARTRRSDRRLSPDGPPQRRRGGGWLKKISYCVHHAAMAALLDSGADAGRDLGYGLPMLGSLGSM